MKAIGIFQREGDRAMPPHGMAKDALPAHVDGKVVSDDLAQLCEEIALHPVVPGIGLLGRIEIEARTGAELPVVGLIRHAVAAWRRVRAYDRDAVRGRGSAVLALV